MCHSNIPAGWQSLSTIIEKERHASRNAVMDAAAMAQGLSDAGEVACLRKSYFDTQERTETRVRTCVGRDCEAAEGKSRAKGLYCLAHRHGGRPAANVEACPQARAQAVVTALVCKDGVAAAAADSVWRPGRMRRWRATRLKKSARRTGRVELVEIATK